MATGQAKLALGISAGAVLMLYVAALESPPWPIEKWRQGRDGERDTERVLKPLRRQGWRVHHDLDRGDNANLDHVVVGSAGVFLLDSKNPSGQAVVEDGTLRIRQAGDGEDSWAYTRIVSQMRAASAELKERIEAATGERVWVQPVVVLWARFPQREVFLSDVAFVHGKHLADWLRSRSPSVRAIDASAINRVLDAWPKGGASS